jgi:hypothetical protein
VALPGEQLRRGEGGGHVRLQDVAPVGQRQLDGRPGALDAGVVDEHVQLSRLPAGALERLLELRRVAHVHLYQQGFRRCQAGDLDGGLLQPAPRARGQHDPGARGGQRYRRRPAEAPTGTGDERRLSVKPERLQDAGGIRRASRR